MYDGKRKTKMTPYNEEEDWKEDEEELRYVILDLKNWSKEEAADLRSRYGFRLINNKWQREEELSEDLWQEMQDFGYNILER